MWKIHDLNARADTMKRFLLLLGYAWAPGASGNRDYPVDFWRIPSCFESSQRREKTWSLWRAQNMRLSTSEINYGGYHRGYEAFQKWSYPKNAAWFIDVYSGKSHEQTDDNWGYPHDETETSICSGWWFGCHFLFSHILGISSSQLTNSYFSEGWPNHQPVLVVQTLQPRNPWPQLDQLSDQLCRPLPFKIYFPFPENTLCPWWNSLFSCSKLIWRCSNHAVSWIQMLKNTRSLI